MHRSGTRGAAGVVALIAWLGLALQVDASLDYTRSLLLTLGILSRFFTILANFAVAIIFSGVAAGSRRLGTSSVLGGVTLSILLVGIVYRLLLYNLPNLRGVAAAADVTVHLATPTLVTVYWLAFVPKGGLGWVDPWRWAAFPTAYFIYALVRAVFEQVYAYPFIDAGTLGWPRTLTNALLIAVGFLVVSYAVVGLDVLLCRRRASALNGPYDPERRTG